MRTSMGGRTGNLGDYRRNMRAVAAIIAVLVLFRCPYVLEVVIVGGKRVIERDDLAQHAVVLFLQRLLVNTGVDDCNIYTISIARPGLSEC